MSTTFNKTSLYFFQGHETFGSRHLTAKEKNDARVCSLTFSKDVWISDKWLIPAGGLMCMKCIRRYNKDKKEEETVSLPKDEEGAMDFDDIDDPMVPSPSSQRQSYKESEKTESIFSGDGDDLQSKRKEHLNSLLKFNNMSKRMERQLQIPIDDYQSNEAMQLLASSIYSVVKTVSAETADHARIWRKFVDGHFLEKRFESFRDKSSADSLLMDVIQAYRRASSSRERTKILTLVVGRYHYSELERFNGNFEKKTRKSDKEDELSHLKVDEFTQFVPDLSYRRYKNARKHLFRSEQIPLAPVIVPKKYIWKLTDQQIIGIAVVKHLLSHIISQYAQ